VDTEGSGELCVDNSLCWGDWLEGGNGVANCLRLCKGYWIEGGEGR
jgi:hypothetical protein